jgi:hypothetical protein
MTARRLGTGWAVAAALFGLLWSGCASEFGQSPTCATYVACLAARDAAQGTETDVVRFEEGGDCWGGKLGYELCDSACGNGLDFLRQREAATLPEACR